MSAVKPYVRPMKGWWTRHPYYLKYMIRESSAVFVTIYALILLRGLWCLVQGKEAWDGWLASLTSPIAILFHIVAMLMAGYHTVTWFKVSPKVMPHIYTSGDSRIPDSLITRVQYVIAAICYLVLLYLTGWA